MSWTVAQALSLPRRDSSRCLGPYRRILDVALRAARLILALLRELSDESAYARYLATHNCAHSGDEWRRFCEIRLRAKYSRAKCC